MKRTLFVIAMLASLQSMGWTDFSKGSQTVAILGGVGGSSTEYDFEPGQKRAVTGGGGAWGAQYLYFLRDTPSIAFGADVAVSPNGSSRERDTFSGYDTVARMRSFTGMLIGRLSFPRGTWRPYLFAGLGAHRSAQYLSATPRSGISWPGGGTESRQLIDERRTSATIGYGIGIDIFPTEAFFIGVELRGAALLGLNTEDNAAIRAAGFTADEEKGIEQGNIFLRAGVKFGKSGS